MDILDEFKKYVLATDNVTINVSYSTFSTMEDELSKLQTGGTVADLVCVSDYIIQRLMALNMVVPFKSGAERTALYGGDATGWDDNYSLYASQYLQNELKGIKATINGKRATSAIMPAAICGALWASPTTRISAPMPLGAFPART
jgi:hypothetical protein